jgi:cobalt-zinc-cadmium efflux system outer membrane protein
MYSRFACITLSAIIVIVLCAPTKARAEDKTSPLSLKQVVLLVLKDNAQLKAAALNVQGAEALHTYSGTFKNPEMAIQLEDFLGTGPMSGFSNGQTTLSLRQTLELGGKRDARTNVAGATLSSQQAAYESRRITILAETLVRFIHVVADQHRLATATRAKELAQRGFTFASQRVRSGAASTIEQQRANIALARTKINEDHSQHDLRASKRHLSMMWGDPEAQFSDAQAELFRLVDLPPYDNLAERIENNPELIRYAKAQTSQQARLALAESRAIPDLKINIGARRFEDSGDYGMVFGLSAPLPVFDRNQGRIHSLKKKEHALIAQEGAERVRLLARLYDDMQEFSHARQKLEVLEREILPEAASVLGFISNGFKSGRFSQIELLDAQRTLVELEQERIDAAEEMWTHAIRIKSLIGVAPFIGAPDKEENTATTQHKQGEQHE